jgi:hypothetical protein
MSINIRLQDLAILYQTGAGINCFVKCFVDVVAYKFKARDTVNFGKILQKIG